MMAPRPRNLLVIAGTSTEVGKTWVAQRLLRCARSQGLRVAARKPAQSFSPESGLTDAELLAAASGEAAESVCPRHRWYAAAMAPPMAAEALGLPPLRLEELLAEIVWPTPTDLALVETAGAVRSPVTHDADNVDLIRRLAPDEVLLVADAGLGTLNAVRLSLQALAGMRVTVLLNRFEPHDDLHRRNYDWLVRDDGAPLITGPEQWRAARGTGRDSPSRG